MPRFAWIVLAACSINADYSKLNVKCSDGKCPSGLTCSAAGECTSGSDHGDAAVDAPADARKAARTCADPGNALGSNSGTTVGGSNHLSGSCGAVVYNANDEIYAVTGPRTITITVDGTGFTASAYVVATCQNGGFPTCEGGSAASPSMTISIGSGTHYIVVDGVNAGLSGSYTLDVH
jgi:hypothetical protein